jgi:hypothetical protein
LTRLATHHPPCTETILSVRRPTADDQPDHPPSIAETGNDPAHTDHSRSAHNSRL